MSFSSFPSYLQEVLYVLEWGMVHNLSQNFLNTLAPKSKSKYRTEQVPFGNIYQWCSQLWAHTWFLLTPQVPGTMTIEFTKCWALVIPSFHEYSVKQLLANFQKIYQLWLLCQNIGKNSTFKNKTKQKHTFIAYLYLKCIKCIQI